MPLTEFLGSWPVWLLREVSLAGDVPSRDAPCPALFFSAYFLGIWGVDLGEVTPSSIRRMTEARSSLLASSMLELNRRLGMLRYRVDPPDGLLESGALHIEVNPAVLAVCRPPFPSPRDARYAELVSRATAAGLASGWADPAAVEELWSLERGAGWRPPAGLG